MTEQIETTEQTEEKTEQNLHISELAELKQRAKRMGISFPPNANLEKMNNLIKEHIAKTEPKQDTQQLKVDNRSEKVRIRDEAMRLIRFKINVLNPAKTKWTGEYFTAGNDLIGHVTRFIPFNAEEGIWHAEAILVEHIKNRRYQSFPSVESKFDRRKGTDDYYKGKLLPEFSIIELPPLTVEELGELKVRQDATGAIDRE